MVLIAWIVLLAFASAACGEECTGEGVYNEAFGKCYYFMAVPVPYTSADMLCENINGKLVSIHNAFEQSVVYETAATRFQNADYWIGLTDFDGDGVWEWADGQISEYTFWNNGFPNSTYGQCAFSVWTNAGRWFNTRCGESYRFVCETTVPAGTTATKPMTTTTLTEDGWISNELTGYQYKNIFASSWLLAEEMCEVAGGHLVSIHSRLENDFVRGMYTTAVYLFIGLSSSDSAPSNFKWSDGTSVDFQNFWEGETPTPTKAACFAMYYNGQWGEENCNEIHYAVCKRPIK